MVARLEIGIIGLGDMGTPYARQFSKLGYRVNGSDTPDRTAMLRSRFYGDNNINILNNGVEVSRRSDIIFYLVPIKNIADAVNAYGPSTKRGAIVSSGASVMTPSIQAFEEHLPRDVKIINWHWLFGPSINPQGQTTVISPYRASLRSVELAKRVFEGVGSNIIELDYEKHDRITADTQAVTHVGFQSMGTAWKNMGGYPWENASYLAGIDNVKILMCLRIFSGKPHVYSGLAFYNPFAKQQIQQYRASTNELFSLRIQGKEQTFRDRVKAAGDFVFGGLDSTLLLKESELGQFSLGSPSIGRKPNSNSSLLAMVDAWHQLGVRPHDNLICQTPLFKLRVGIAESLFRSQSLLDESITASMADKTMLSDDLAFTLAVNEWARIIIDNDERGYTRQFEEVQTYFGQPRLDEGKKRSNDLINSLKGAA